MIKRGAWVKQIDNGETPQFGRVRDVWPDRQERRTYLDIVLYASDGARLGRVSPACGGPTSFEPSCPAEYWVEIEPPTFPLSTSRFERDYSYDHLLKVKP